MTISTDGPDPQLSIGRSCLFCRIIVTRWIVHCPVYSRDHHWPVTNDPVYKSRKNRKFRADKFDTWNKRKFWLIPAVYKRLGTSRLRELHESKFPFVPRIEFIRSKLSNFSAHVYGANDHDYREQGQPKIPRWRSEISGSRPPGFTRWEVAPEGTIPATAIGM